jgi:hypothetical protein
MAIGNEPEANANRNSHEHLFTPSADWQGFALGLQLAIGRLTVSAAKIGAKDSVRRVSGGMIRFATFATDEP